MRLRLMVLLLVVSSVSCTNRHWPAALGGLTPAPIPRFEHVIIVVEENANYADVIGNMADMPYLNTLAVNYGVATNYYADTHPSINNYFYLTAGLLRLSLNALGVEQMPGLAASAPDMNAFFKSKTP